ncbi:PREDICTED: olfactory receptor 9A4-like [Elephantulus edwardii]|uniref:olfactory receptor 9A4-like n=1 Tax=Elephantulus edwardii TaxID=28737 RepID=UPI0003F0C071|nr:PREDICTED: olfactory receptor 9A4-like [Elephantulus edwardii]
MLVNYSSATEFYLLGFPGSQELRHILFVIFLFLYSMTLMGNSVIIVIVCADRRLKSPMYFFLGHLSVMEVLITTVISPVMLCGLLLPGMQAVSLRGCVAQLFLYLAVGTAEFSLLAVMAVDRYVAVCNPLRYSAVMNSHACTSLVACSWVFGFLFQIWPVYATFQLAYCKDNVVNNFFCDRGQLLKLSCDDTLFTEFILFLMAVFVLFGSLIPTIVSYTYIISTILRIPSASGRRKAFSTCASHFTCVVLGYGSCFFLYVKPKQTQASDYNRTVSLMVTVVTPFLNPFIFTLRNDKVLEVLRDGVKRCCHVVRN